MPASDPRRLVLRPGAVAALALITLGCRGESLADVAGDVRGATQAGRFYSASSPKLRAAVTAFIEDAVPARAPHPLALVVPHAGYIFSGQIAADAYRQAAGETLDTVVILGTNHTVPGFERVGLSPASGFATPLGVAAVDQDLRSALLAGCRDCVLDTGVHADEHSVEVQVPFVQVLFPAARILPVVVGTEDLAVCRRFGLALARLLEGRRALIVASSDLSHYPAAEAAEALDREALAVIASLDPDRVRTTLTSLPAERAPGLSTRACGTAPILATLYAARALGATRGTVLSYANSGRMTISVGRSGSEERVVGYGAVAFTTGEAAAGAPVELGQPRPGTGERIGDTERRQLMAFARATLQRYLATETVPLPRGFGARLWQRQGVFVTLKKKGDLRGCIGRIPPQAPLAPLVGAMALAAAFEDPRFTRLEAAELPQVKIEISALTQPKPIAHPREIVVGRDGVLLRQGSVSAVFLPQVATERGWGRDEMLDSLCTKGRLPRGCWRSGAELAVFQAEVFREE